MPDSFAIWATFCIFVYDNYIINDHLKQTYIMGETIFFRTTLEHNNLAHLQMLETLIREGWSLLHIAVNIKNGMLMDVAFSRNIAKI